MKHRTLSAAGAAVIVVVAGTTAAAATEPASLTTIDNCGVTVAVGETPQRAITMNQSSTEVMLALGLEDAMVGTAYLDDEILPDLADAYAAVPVLADEYPSSEVVLDAEPDFVYAAYASAFNADAAGERSKLADLGIGSYLSGAACPDRADDQPLTLDDVFQEILDIGAIFGVSDTAEARVAEQSAALDAAPIADLDGLTVAWWDGGLDAPTVGACCGAPGMIMSALGLDNVFDDLERGWADASWEAFVDADPDIIIAVDASWDPAADKLAHLRSDPALADLTAVTEGRIVTIPFSATTPGVRNAPAIATLADDIAEAIGVGETGPATTAG